MHCVVCKTFFAAWMQTLWKMSWLLASSGTWRTQTRLTWPGLTEFKCLCCLWFAKFPALNIISYSGGCPILTWEPSLGCPPLPAPWWALVSQLPQPTWLVTVPQPTCYWKRVGPKQVSRRSWLSFSLPSFPCILSAPWSTLFPKQWGHF